MRYVYALLALGLLIAVHELGHLVAARLFGIRVRRFSLGFGPPLLSFRAGRIEWALGAIPIGGYTLIHGMNPHGPEGQAVGPDSYQARPWWQRELVLFAGAATNALLAVVVLVSLFMSGTHVAVKLTVGTVEPGSEAARAQLRPGDVITAVDGVPVSEWRELADRIADAPGRTLRLEVRRADAAPMEILVTPRADAGGTGRIGISQQYVYRQHTFREALSQSVDYILRVLRDGAETLWRLVSGRPGALGAVPLMKEASDVAASGLDAFLRVLVHLSVALGIFYLLPFPSLDGGRMLFVAIEAIRGRPVSPKLETALHALGFVALLGLLLCLIRAST